MTANESFNTKIEETVYPDAERNAVCFDVGAWSKNIFVLLSSITNPSHYFDELKNRGLHVVLKNDARQNANFYRAVNGFFMGRGVEVEKIGIWN